MSLGPAIRPLGPRRRVGFERRPAEVGRGRPAPARVFLARLPPGLIVRPVAGHLERQGRRPAAANPDEFS